MFDMGLGDGLGGSTPNMFKTRNDSEIGPSRRQLPNAFTLMPGMERSSKMEIKKKERKERVEKERAVSNMPLGRERKKKTEFNPSQYVPFESLAYNNVQDIYKKQFYENKEVNKVKIHQQLTELVYLQINERLNKDAARGLPVVFEDNKVKWTEMLIKNKKFQKVFYDFTERVSRLLEEELHHSGQLVRDYLRYPHSVCRDPSKGEVWLPKHEPKVKKKVFTVTAKAKQKLKVIEQEVKTKKDELAKEFMNKMKQVIKAPMVKRREFRALPEKKYRHPVFQQIDEKLKKVDNKINSLEANTNQLKHEVDETEHDMTNLHHSKTTKYPGLAIQKMMDAWGDEEVMTINDLKEYSKVMHKTAAEFEKELRAQELGIEMQMRVLKEQYSSRVEGIRQTTSFRMEALETALIETKINYQRKADRAEMKLAEMESFLLNQQMNEKQIEKDMDQVDDLMNQLQQQQQRDKEDKNRYTPNEDEKKPAASINAIQFLKVLGDLKKNIKSLQMEKVELEKNVTDLKYNIASQENFVEKVQDDFRNSKELVLFYQIIIYDILSRTKLFETGSPATESDKLLFQEIVQLNEERARIDLEEQKTLIKPDPKKQLTRLSQFVEDVHDIMLALNVQNIFSTYQLVIDDKFSLMKQLLDQLREVGVIGGNKNALASKRRGGIMKKASGNFSKDHEQFLNMLTATPMGMNQQQKQLLTTMAEKLLVPNTEETIAAIEEYEQVIEENREQVVDIETLNKPQRDGDEQRILSSLGREFKRIMSNSRLAREGMTDSALSIEEIKQRQATIKTKLIESVNQKQSKRLAETKKRERQEAKEIAKEAQKELAKEQRLRVGGSRPNAYNSIRQNVASVDRNSSRTSRNNRFIESAEASGRVGSSNNESMAYKESIQSIQPHKTVKGKKSLRAKRRGNEEVSPTEVDVATDEQEVDSESPSKPVKKAKTKKDKSKKQMTKKEGGFSKSKTSMQKSGNINKNSSDLKTKSDLAKKQKASTLSNKKTLKAGDNTPTIKIKKRKEEGSSGWEGEEEGLESAFDTDSNKTEPLDHFQTAMDDFENRLLDKYQEELNEVEECTDSQMKLGVEPFQQLYATFTQSLGRDLSNKDYLEMFENLDFDNFINNINSFQKKYLARPEAPDPNLADQYLKDNTPTNKDGSKLALNSNSGSLHASTQKLPKKKKKKGVDFNRLIPFTDCILTEIDQDGNLYGFHLRPQLMKLMYWKDDYGIENIQKLIKCVNYMNRLILQPNQEFLLAQKVDGPKSFEVDCQTDFPPAEVEVKTPIYVQEPDPSLYMKMDKETQLEIARAREALKEKEEKANELTSLAHRKTPDLDKSDTLRDFIDVIRSHIIDILLRENPSRRAYYKLVWEKQSIDELLAYKLPDVFDEIPDGGFEDGEKPEEQMTVVEYFTELFGQLNRKLQDIIPRHKKEHLSINRLVYTGDDMDSDISSRHFKEFEGRGMQTIPVKVFSMEEHQEIKDAERRQELAKQRALMNKLHTGTQTPYDMLPSRTVKEHVPAFGGDKDIIKQIDKAMGEEMQKTIDTLNDFVDKVKQANQTERRKKKTTAASSLFSKKKKSLEGEELSRNAGRTEVMKNIRKDLIEQQENMINDLDQFSKEIEYQTRGKKFNPQKLQNQQMYGPSSSRRTTRNRLPSHSSSSRQESISPKSTRLGVAKLPKLKTFIKENPIRQPQTYDKSPGTSRQVKKKKSISTVEQKVSHMGGQSQYVNPFKKLSPHRNTNSKSQLVGSPGKNVNKNASADFPFVKLQSNLNTIDAANNSTIINAARKSSFFTSEAPTSNTKPTVGIDKYSSTVENFTHRSQKKHMMSPVRSNLGHNSMTRNFQMSATQGRKFFNPHMEAAAFIRRSNDKARFVKDGQLTPTHDSRPSVPTQNTSLPETTRNTRQPSKFNFKDVNDFQFKKGSLPMNVSGPELSQTLNDFGGQDYNIQARHESVSYRSIKPKNGFQ